MTRFQEDAIIALNAGYNREEFSKFAKALFRMLELNNIEFEPLAIAVADMDLEEVLPEGLQISEFMQRINIEKLMRASIVFDLYIPSKRWVANLACIDTKECDDCKEYLQRTIIRSVNDTVEKVVDVESVFPVELPIVPHCSLQTILRDAVKNYFNRQNINHPLDSVPALRSVCNSYGYLLSPDNIDRFIYQIKNQA